VLEFDIYQSNLLILYFRSFLCVNTPDLRDVVISRFQENADKGFEDEQEEEKTDETKKEEGKKDGTKTDEKKDETKRREKRKMERKRRKETKTTL